MEEGGGKSGGLFLRRLPRLQLSREFPNPHLDLGKPVEEAEIKVKNSDKATCFP